MRIFTRLLLITAFFAVVSLVHSFVISDHQDEIPSIMEKKFITLTDGRANVQLVALRNSCGDAKLAISELQNRIGNDDGEDEGVSYDELVGEILDYLLSERVISRDCLFEARNSRIYAKFGPFEGSGYVLLTENGDVAVGVYGQATMPWSMVNHSDGWLPDVLLWEKDERAELHVIELPNSDSMAAQANVLDRLLSIFKVGRG